MKGTGSFMSGREEPEEECEVGAGGDDETGDEEGALLEWGEGVGSVGCPESFVVFAGMKGSTCEGCFLRERICCEFVFVSCFFHLKQGGMGVLFSTQSLDLFYELAVRFATEVDGFYSFRWEVEYVHCILIIVFY